ncbi:MAG: PAS domain S-box protein [Acidobacteria bacterium]|nr:PAS domain S-box protein [Acidobacteriota bacterium]
MSVASVLVLGAVVVLVEREVGRRARAEADLRTQNTVLELILANMADGVVVADERARFTHFNPAAERIVGVGKTGAGPEEWGRHYGVFLPDGVTPYPQERYPLLRALRGEDTDGDEQLIRNAGYPAGVVIRVTGRPMRDASGAVRGGLAVFRDVTAERRSAEEIRSLNEELRKKVAELEAANAELESFSYSVSHDLRAPLRHVHGFVDLLRKRAGASLDETGRRHLDVIAEASRHMGQLIDDLLAFSRMGRVEMRTARVDLATLVAEVVGQVGREAEGRTIDWAIGDLPGVVGDRALLRIALVNLLSNAVKYTRPRGRARIEVGAQAATNGRVVLFVRDDGVGFDMRYADKLFGVFQRLHRAEEFEGTGIGLATVRRVVNRHGGEVWAEATPESGATFYVSLPPDEGRAG